jgi:hypothetical protein
MKSSTLLLFASLISLHVFSQTDSHEGHEHHKHHKNEIGIANSPVYFVKEKEISYGLHLHYVRNLSETKFGIGVGYERIFDDHEHTTFGIVGSYRPIDRWSINCAPGITYEHNEISELAFALHLETAYEWEIHNFHIGPVLELAYDPEDYHVSFGLHVGVGF